MKRLSSTSRLIINGVVLGLVVGVAGQPAGADEPDSSSANVSPTDRVSVRLEEAIELALLNNYALRKARLDQEDAEAQVSQEWARVWPSIDGAASYDRNLAAPNPFAGTGAGGAFNAFNGIGWLAFNEEARTDDNPNTEPLSFIDWSNRTNQALENAGVIIDPDANAFLVENQFSVSLAVRQVLYDGAIYAGLRGTDVLEEIAEVGVDAEAQRTVQDTASAFYGALLASRQTEILEKSVARTQETVDETKKRVDQGVVPRFQLLTAEVELANLQTDLARARNASLRALDDLRLVIGLPATQPLEVRGELTLEGVPAEMPPAEEAVAVAYSNRPDFQQAKLAVKANLIQEDATIGELFPTLSAVANIALIGTVPDDRTFTVPDPTFETVDGEDRILDPFPVRVEESGFFSEAFWFANVSVGLQLEWKIFDGFETWSRYRRNQVETRKARVDLEQARVVVQLEVAQALRELRTARQQIETQQRNRARAELNYEHAQVRVREGVSNQFELRQASEQLDESRFNYLQAVHDFLVARISYLVAVGTPPILEKQKDE